MSFPTESVFRPLDESQSEGQILSDRRMDVEAKQARVAQLLEQQGCVALLIVEPENFSWFTSGATVRGSLDLNEAPALFIDQAQRWLLASNVESQRYFDEDLHGLGFQLKEWPWHWGRSQMITDLIQGRRVAVDRAYGPCKNLAEQLASLRRAMTNYEQACLRTLGEGLAHSIEATCRTMIPNQTEREIAGQVAHRLLHRGIQPTIIRVAGDGRARRYRHAGFTRLPVKRQCTINVTGTKYGLFATAGRSVCFGPPDDTMRHEFDAACKVTATYVAATWPNAVTKEMLAAGRRVYQLSGYEHEWLSAGQGHITGRLPVEIPLLPSSDLLLQPGWAVTWNACTGAASSCDTFLITEEGAEIVTPVETWALKMVRVQGAEFERPYLLVR